MIQYLQDLERQISDALLLGRKFSLPQSYQTVSNIVFSGMGGSAIGGDLLALLAWQASAVPFQVNRFTALPKSVNSKTFLILSSYSGNTFETLSAFEEGLKRKARMCVITSGGRLALEANKRKIPVLLVPPGLPPRCAIGYMGFSLMPALSALGFINVSRVDLNEILALARKEPRKEARLLAREMHGLSVHFYGVAGFAEPVLARWRAQLAENSKMLASHHVLPEMLHNEIEGWRFPEKILGRSAVFFLFDKKSPAWLVKKIKGIRSIIEKSGATTFEVKASGRSLLARVFSLMLLGDWVSYELALLNQADPLAIPNIEALKKLG